MNSCVARGGERVNVGAGEAGAELHPLPEGAAVWVPVLGVAFGVLIADLIACASAVPSVSGLALGPFVPRAARVAFADAPREVLLPADAPHRTIGA